MFLASETVDGWMYGWMYDKKLLSSTFIFSTPLPDILELTRHSHWPYSVFYFTCHALLSRCRFHHLHQCIINLLSSVVFKSHTVLFFHFADDLRNESVSNGFSHSANHFYVFSKAAFPSSPLPSVSTAASLQRWESITLYTGNWTHTQVISR